MAEPLIIQYANLLHKHGGPRSRAALAFVARHSDADFRRRARAFAALFPRDREAWRRKVLDTPLP